MKPDARFLGVSPVEQGDVADPRDERRGGPLAEFVDYRVAVQPVFRAHPHLDKFVMFDAELEFPEQRIGNPGIADCHDRLELVPEPA